MITSKVILKEYIDADKSRNMVNCSAKYLLIEPFLSLFEWFERVSMFVNTCWYCVSWNIIQMLELITGGA